MGSLSLENPVFIAYALGASVMILKLMAQGWITVYLMIRTNAGLLNPEDLLPGPANRNPRADQLEPNETVERSRRVQRNDLESIPAFLAAGLLFVVADPPVWLAVFLTVVFVVARIAHTVAYSTRQRHEVRATIFSVGSIVVIVMALYVLVAALGAAIE
jgi:glutathione S-transferase